MSVYTKPFFTACGFLFFVVFTGVSLSAQEILTAIAPESTKLLHTWAKENPQEKVYLHLDKELYLQGQSIWYKAYVITEPYSTLDTLTNNLYVELVDARSKIIERQTLFLKAGLGYGSFDLPQDINSGLYYLRAYTNWMRNFDEAFYFLRPIEIENTEDRIKVDMGNPLSGHIDLQFFPEGGDLLNGITSKLAFKATNEQGRGIDVKGAIFNSFGEKVNSFLSTHQGMGYCYFLPQAGEDYYAQIDGEERKYALPMASDKGYALSVNNSNEQEFSIIIISQMDSSVQQKPYVLVQADGRAYRKINNINFGEDGQSLISIPKAGLPTGIMQVTLFNGDGLPESERLIFVDNNDQLRVKVKASDSTFETRQQVDLNIQVTNKAGEPVSGSFSLAVVNEAYRSLNRFETHISAEFLLDADIRGQLERPAQYFDPENEYRHEDLDLLLMTQGWRRFIWKDLLKAKTKVPVYEFENSLAISGRVLTNNRRAEEVPNALVSFVDMSREVPVAATTRTDASGWFSFPELSYDNRSAVMLKVQTEKGRQNLKFELDTRQMDSLALPVRSLSYLYELSADASLGLSAMREFDPVDWPKGEFIDLGSFMVEGQKAEKRNKRIERTPYGSQILNVKEMMQSSPGPIGVLDLLVGRLPGVSAIRYGPAPDQIQIRSTRGRRGMMVDNNGVLQSQEMLFLLDGLPLDAGMAANIRADHIETIEVFIGNAAAMYGIRGANGVISLTSKEIDISWSGPEMPGAQTLDGFGYANSREFYAPKYGKPLEEEKLDQRSVLAWVPNIITNQQGEAKLSFWTGDLEGKFLIDLQGIGLNGLTGVNIGKTIKVNKQDQ